MSRVLKKFKSTGLGDRLDVRDMGKGRDFLPQTPIGTRRVQGAGGNDGFTEFHFTYAELFKGNF